MTTHNASYLDILQQLINQHFNLAEVQDLCFRLHIDYESVPGDQKPSRIRALLLGLGRKGRLPELIDLLKIERPKMNWPPVPEDFELPAAMASSEKAQHIINTGGGAYIGGNVNTSGGEFIGRDLITHGDVVHGDNILGDKVQGDKISVTGDIAATNVAIGSENQQQASVQNESSPLDIAAAFATIQTAVDQANINTAQKVVVKTAVDTLHTEADKGEEADVTTVEEWLRMLAQMAPDIAEVAINTFIHPINGISTIFKKVAQKIRSEQHL